MISSTQSKLHQLRTVQQNKLSLSGYDDKRQIREDKVNTYAHAHCRILQDEIKAQNTAVAAAANDDELMDVDI
ncbi:hypothetical protein B566_EDAN002473 [Ephemera danica]|nr:hypothetical protein B566_EDAN002473 [Ephemera danica]